MSGSRCDRPLHVNEATPLMSQPHLTYQPTSGSVYFHRENRLNDGDSPQPSWPRKDVEVANRHSGARDVSSLPSSSFPQRATTYTEEDALLSEVAGCPRDLFQRAYCVTGVDITIWDATVIETRRFNCCYPRSRPPRVLCEGAVSLMRKGKLHLIIDVDGRAGLSLIMAATGGTYTSSGSVLADGVPVEASMFRKAAGFVSRKDMSDAGLTVAENISFVVQMRCKTRRSWRRTIVEASCVLLHLDPKKKSHLLTPSEKFRLHLAMELAVDPPVIFAAYPLDGMNCESVAECAAALMRVAVVLGKTVIVSGTRLPSHLFDAADTILLFGEGGLVLYSGKKEDLVEYFKSLPCDIFLHKLSPIQPATDAHPAERSTSQSSAGCPFQRSGYCEIPRCEGVPVSLRPSNGVLVDAALGGDGGENSRSSLARSDTSHATAQDIIAFHIREQVLQQTLYDGEDVLDLAVLWSEDPNATWYFAAKYRESTIRLLLERTIASYLAPQRDGGSAPLPVSQKPQRAYMKPILLLASHARRTFTHLDFFIGFACLSLALLSVSLLMRSQAESQGGMYNLRGILFCLFLLTLITNMLSIPEWLHQLRLFVHQRDGGLYNSFIFLLVLSVRITAVRGIYLALFVPVVLLVLQSGGGELLALIVAVSIAHAFLMLAVLSAVPSVRIAILVLQGYLVYCIVFSGFLLNLTTLPPGVGSMSIMRWGYGAALELELRGKPFSCDGALNTSYCYTGSDYLNLEGFQDDSAEQSLCILVVMSCILFVILAVVLPFTK